jgi:hypothetical protein
MLVSTWLAAGETRLNRRRLRRELDVLGLPGRFTVGQLAAALALRRGRPLRLRPEQLPAEGVTGGLLVTDEVDFIAYQIHTSELHRNHIICHEFGHLLAGHHTVAVRGAEALRLLAPHIDPVVIRRMLGRNSYVGDDELEAEAIAGMLMQHHISHWTAVDEWFMPDTAAITHARRLLDTLGPGEF